MLRIQANREFFIVILSLLVQLPLAVFLGHYYDQRVFMATGYEVGLGLNPYQPHFITAFSNTLLTGTTPIIGYPPPWPLLAGLIYRFIFNSTQSLFLYNFALKIPIIAGNIALAYLVKNMLEKLNRPSKTVQAAWLFLLFNPFILLTTSAWGQLDTIVAFLCVLSIYFLTQGMIEKCGLTFALSIALKPIALPLVGLPLLLSGVDKNRKLIYLLILTGGFLAFGLLPFYLMGWTVPSSSNELTAHVTMAGGLTPFNLLEVFYTILTLPSGLEFLGYIWIGALILGYYAVYRSQPKSISDLAQASFVLLLIFFLTRTWLSEPNINLIIPLALLTILPEEMNFQNFAFLWVIPLFFMIPNTSFSQLFFLTIPSWVTVPLTLGGVDLYFWRLIAKFFIAVVWQVFAWRMVIKLLRRKKEMQTTAIF